MTYTIQINEEQRAIIEAALAYRVTAGAAFLTQSEDEEATLLKEMFAQLPTIEDTHNTTHGFCF